MPRPALNPLDYVNIHTRLPLHMHRWFTLKAIRLGVERAILYTYALKFAYHSDTEFSAFVREIQKGKAKNVTMPKS